MITRTKIDPARLEQFALAYAPVLLSVILDTKPYYPAMITAEQFTADTAADILNVIQRAGVEAASQYYVNGAGGAFRLTCQALGIPDTIRAMEDYLGGQ